MKRKYKTGECADCGGAMKVARSNQKYCFACRLARAARIHRGEAATCPSCDQPFIDWLDPLHRSPGHNLCGRCFTEHAPRGGRESVPGPCGWLRKGTCLSPADREAWVYSENVRLCYPCLTDPAKFDENRKAILAKHRALTAARTDGTVEVGQPPSGAEQETE